MPILMAHAAMGTQSTPAEKQHLREQMHLEVLNAKRIQAQIGCSWTQALKAAVRGNA